MVGRGPLKSAAGVRFVHSPPLAAGAIGSASDSDSEGSRFQVRDLGGQPKFYGPFV